MLLNPIFIVCLVDGLRGDWGNVGAFSFLMFWMLRKVCKCMCAELKADLMGSGEPEPSCGSVTYHQTLGSHDGLIISGIVCSLSIIKTNQ